MGHRNYAGGVLGRFISRDPIGHRGDFNLYSYTTSPIDTVDSSGLQEHPGGLYDPSGRYEYIDWDPTGELTPIGELLIDNIDYIAGFGDSMGFSLPYWIRKILGTDHLVDTESDEYCQGEFHSLVVGVGRLAYAGVVKGIPKLASLIHPNNVDKAAKTASGMRNFTKFGMRGPLGGRLYRHEKLLKKYGSARAVLAASGRTGRFENAFGVYVICGNAASRASKD